MTELINTEFYKQHGFSEIRRINAGFSGDEKYCVKTDSGERFLVKLFAKKTENAIKIKAERMTKMADAGVPMARFVSYELCGDGRIISFYTWCDGDLVSDLLRKQSVEQSHELGLQAGRVLYKIHSVPVEYEPFRVHVFIKRRVRRALEIFESLGISEPLMDSLALYFKNKDLEFLKERRGCLIHTDYHTANITYSKKNGVQIIDWNDIHYSDPLSDLAYVYDAAKFDGGFRSFASGLLHGYLEGGHEEDFGDVFSFFFGLKVFDLTARGLRNHVGNEKRIAVRTKSNYSALNWFDTQCGLKEFGFSDEITEEIKKRGV